MNVATPTLFLLALLNFYVVAFPLVCPLVESRCKTLKRLSRLAASLRDNKVRHHYKHRKWKPKQPPPPPPTGEWAHPRLYWKRTGLSPQEFNSRIILSPNLPQEQTPLPLSFIDTEVIRHRARLVTEVRALPNEDTLDNSSSCCTRSDFLQFMTDLCFVFQTMEHAIIEANHSQVLKNFVPSTRHANLKADAEYLKQLLQRKDTPLPSSGGTSYSALLWELAQKNFPGFVAHLYTFHVEWAFSAKHTLTALATYLSIPRNFKATRYDTDVLLLSNYIDRLASQWNRVQKDAFLSELLPSLEAPMTLTKSLLGTKPVTHNSENS